MHLGEELVSALGVLVSRLALSPVLSSAPSLQPEISSLSAADSQIGICSLEFAVIPSTLCAHGTPFLQHSSGFGLFIFFLFNCFFHLLNPKTTSYLGILSSHPGVLMLQMF